MSPSIIISDRAAKDFQVPEIHLYVVDIIYTSHLPHQPQLVENDSKKCLRQRRMLVTILFQKRNTLRRRRRDSVTVELSRVGGVYGIHN